MEKRTNLGDTPEHVWMLEFLERCFPESGERVRADLDMVIAMCKAEPKNAQFAMQSLAQRIRSGLRGEALAFVRFALGVLFRIYTAVAYAEGRCGEGDLPAELELPVRWNPEIIECAEEVGALFSDNDQD